VVNPKHSPAVKLLHVPFTWYPAACGGTEVYVRALVRELAQMGCESEIAAPGTENKTEQADDARVHHIAVPAGLTQAMLYGEGEPASAKVFARVLDDAEPDIVHFHAYSPAASVRWLEAARSRGIPCVYTYHTPTLTCGRGTLMRWGTEPCDGTMTPLRCSACTLHGLGLSQPLSWALAGASPVLQTLSARVPFRSWPLMNKRTTAVRRWLDGMSRVVALCEWGKAVMARNHVPPERLRLVRHGLAGGGRQGDWETERREDGETLEVAFFGRLDRTKGLDVLVEALRLMPGLEIELHCHLIMDEGVKASMNPLLNQMKADPRVKLHPPVTSDEVVRTMSAYDAVVAPSIWLETGPLVVLEAFEAGVPVLGSRLGGIAEWVTHERDGLLIAPGDAAAWARELKRLVDEPALRTRLRTGVRPPPKMREVARQMESIYREIVSPPIPSPLPA